MLGALSQAESGAKDSVAEDANIAKTQVFLDRANFGPGKIDGKQGEFTRIALARYHEAHGGMEVSLPELDVPLLADYTVTDEDAAHVGEVPSSIPLKAKQKTMPYPSLLELVAERFHASPAYLKEINPGKDMDALKTGDTVKVPNVVPFKIETLKVKGEIPGKADLKGREIVVNTSQRILDVKEKGEVIASFPITPGSERLPAPKGTWRIESITTLPVFRWDKQMLTQGKRSSEGYVIPPGPRNLVGVVWMELNKPGIGIHGTDSPDTIGRSASHGCIRLSNWDVDRLSQLVTKGATVEIK
jgi:lipoprotein-anchoring transpeptidase ErfK/SrfK